MQDIQERKEKKACPLPPLETRAVDEARSLAEKLTAEGEFDEWKVFFRLARRLWSLEGVCDESYDGMLTAVATFIEELYGDEVSSDIDEFEENDERWLVFVDAWFKVRYPEGQGPLEVAFRKAEANPVQMEHRFRNKDYGRFISMCYYLQADRGGDPILLPVERVGALFGKDKMHGSRLVRIARRAGKLRLGSEYHRGAHRARMFYFDLRGTPTGDVGESA